MDIIAKRGVIRAQALSQSTQMSIICIILGTIVRGMATLKRVIPSLFAAITAHLVATIVAIR